MRLSTPWSACVLATVIMMWPAGSALAHAFGGRYDLPLPLHYYQYAAGLAVLLSFVVLARFVRPAQEFIAVEERGILLGTLSTLPKRMNALSAVVYLLIMLAALLGENRVMENIAPTFVWIWVWVGVAFLAAIFGDVWKLLSPFPALARLIGARRRYRLPAGLGRWPAFASFLVFAWLELVSGFGEQPFLLGMFMTAYLLWLLVGMWLFGIRQWLESADIFENVFALYGRFGVLRLCRTGDHELAVRLQWPGIGLLSKSPVHGSQTAIIIALLATVSFDGILETPAWFAVQDWIENSQAWRPLLLAVHAAGINTLAFVKTLALLAAPAVFALAYASCILLMRLFGGRQAGSGTLFNVFALSLVPIAVAYHLAHYLSYLATAGQQLLPLLSDPLGSGWDIFGTRDYSIKIGIISPKTVWIFSAVAIVFGHVVSVVLAHQQAAACYRTTGRMIVSQLPMIALMVGYTMVSLWILSQPIVEGG